MSIAGEILRYTGAAALEQAFGTAESSIRIGAIEGGAVCVRHGIQALADEAGKPVDCVVRDSAAFPFQAQFVCHGVLYYQLCTQDDLVALGFSGDGTNMEGRHYGK